MAEKPTKLSHKQFRALLKKFRRKKKRQRLAKERESQELLEKQKKESLPDYKSSEEERQRNARLFDEFEERERLREHKLWLLREEEAQAEFARKQKYLEIERLKKEEERKRILAEFEAQQNVEKKAETEKEKIKSQKEEALQEALSNLSEDNGPWHNPVAPLNYCAGVEREKCMFFIKTGCCKFGERCSRAHVRPEVSNTILIRGMYSHMSIGQTSRDDFDTDDILEYEEKERYQDFVTFFKDTLPEFKKFGRVVQFKVCCNHEPHLRGNVYIQYTKEEDAIEAYRNFNGRYYGGKQLTCEFTSVIKWRSAICGLSFRRRCPKGINCNFLHVFRNPTDEFWEADRDLLPRSPDPPRSRHHGSGRSPGYGSSSRHHSRREPDSSRKRKGSSRRDSPSDRRRREHSLSPENHEERSSRKKKKKKKSKKKKEVSDNSSSG